MEWLKKLAKKNYKRNDKNARTSDTEYKAPLAGKEDKEKSKPDHCSKCPTCVGCED